MPSKPSPPSGAEVDRAAELLRSALAPGSLDRADHEALLAMVLGDEAAEVPADEQAAAEELRSALEGGAPHPLAELAGALRAAYLSDAPSEEKGHLAGADHEALIVLALGLEASRDQEAARLAEALAGRGVHPLADLAMALRAAERPDALDPADGEALVGLSLGTELSVGDDARREAVALRDALVGRGDHPLLPWSTALRAAAGRIGSLDDVQHERILRRALNGASSRPGVVIATIVAMAAAVALFLGTWRQAPDAPVAENAPAAELVSARSTESLFDPTVPFGSRGGESERMERIVEARAADLRANRFAAWGVR